MNRTINERKALKGILISLGINMIGFGLFGYTERVESIIGVVISLGLYSLSLLFFGYNCYSLGWEYKRINLEDDA